MARRVPAKKVSRACIHCRNGHLTCDDSRPCKRCIKRGLESTCIDAPRKTKKYLFDDMNSVNMTTNANSSSTTTTIDMNLGNILGSSSVGSNESGGGGGGGDMATGFVSSAADSEYSTLGTIIYENPSKRSPFTFPLQPIEMNKTVKHILYPLQPHCDLTTNQYFIGNISTIDGIKTYTFPEIVKQISIFKDTQPLKFNEINNKSLISFCIGTVEEENELNTPTDTKTGLLYHEPSEIYEKVKKPFTYVKPYHDLNVYLKSRFSKNDLVKMSKSIAEYRPSFIAGMIKLKEDDLIFAEQCFQRTLLEYDSYISISGTPTLVWRRTSQIAYVGDEFCILTGWNRDQLLSKSTFAVEIMDDKSCVEYFRLFSKIAFGDTNGDVMTDCTLLTPNGENIRTSSTWTLKRDVFGIPMMIIATFLPILT